MMEISLEELQVQPVACIRIRTSADRLPQVIGEGYMRIAQYLQEIGEQPAGVPYTAYFNLDMQNMEIEIGFPVSKPLPDTEQIKAGELPAGKVVSASYKGPYSAMESGYNEIFKFIAEKGFQPKGVYYEYYFNSPKDVPESELLTKIIIPLK